MNVSAKVFFLLCLIGSGQSATAREQHLEASVPQESLQPALERFSRDLREMQDLLSRELIHADLAEVHNLTYSLQDSLTQIEATVKVLQQELKDVQLAAERGEQITAKEQGIEFLDRAEPLLD